MNPPNLGKQGVMFLSPSLTTEGSKGPSTFPSTQRTRGILNRVTLEAKIVWGWCGYCGMEVYDEFAHEVNGVVWHQKCLTSEINRREAIL